jgi:hypothetical protein
MQLIAPLGYKRASPRGNAMSFFTRLTKSNPYHDEHGQFTDATHAGMTLTKVSGAKGSNDGGVFADAQGHKFYVKFYANPDQARTEELASGLFELMGNKTPGPRVTEVNGKQALVTAWNDRLEQLSPHDFKKLSDTQNLQVARMYHAATLTKNWDVLGLVHDNLVRHKDTGEMVEVDTGGSFNFRAQGGHKDYGPDIAEQKSLRNPQNASGDVFNHVFSKHPDLEKTSLDTIQHLDMGKVKGLFEKSGLKNRTELYDNFAKRRTALLAHYGVK